MDKKEWERLKALIGPARITAERNHQVMREYSRAWVECLQGVEQHFDDGKTLWVVPCETYVVRVAE